MVTSISAPGDVMNTVKEPFNRPDLTAAIEASTVSTTGYTNRKGWRSEALYDLNWMSTLSEPLFRASESYLIYLEAYYLRNGNLGGNCDKYWRALRNRAKVDADYMKTIAATDLSKENDLAVYSGADMVDATLYNIRRERRCELFAEGLRKDDLYRWRALDNMKNYHVMGYNLWTENYKAFPDKVLKPGPNSGSNVSAKGTVPGDDGNYVFPYRKVSSSPAYNGYTFPKTHYLSPISYDAIRLSVPVVGDDLSTAILYQNPGWPIITGGFANE